MTAPNRFTGVREFSGTGTQTSKGGNPVVRLSGDGKRTATVDVSLELTDNTNHTAQIGLQNGELHAILNGTQVMGIDSNGVQSSTVGFLQSGTGAVNRSIQDKNRDVVSAFDFMTPTQIADVRARTLGQNVATALTAAILYCSTNGAALYFPRGTYFIGTTTLVLKNNVKYYGEGADASFVIGSVIWYTGTSDAIQINNPINSSTDAHITIEDIAVKCTTKTAGKAAIADVGSTYLNLRRVCTYGNDYGLILDQSELVTVEQCEFELGAISATAGIWLVNGAAHTALGANFRTNQIKIRDCQFNGTGGIGIADDGGASHAFVQNNFNAMATSIRINATYALAIEQNEFENPTTTAISFAVTTHAGAAGATSTIASLSQNFFSSPDAISFVTLAASSVTSLTTSGLHFNNANAGGSPFSGLSAGATDYIGSGNKQVGTGAATSLALGNNYNNNSTFTVTMTGVSGSVTATVKYTQNGKQITMDVPNLNGTSNATTKGGTGVPADIRPTATKRFVVTASDNGGAYATGTARLNTDGTLQYYPNGAFGNWTASGTTDILEHQISYTLN